MVENGGCPRSVWQRTVVQVAVGSDKQLRGHCARPAAPPRLRSQVPRPALAAEGHSPVLALVSPVGAGAVLAGRSPCWGVGLVSAAAALRRAWTMAAAVVASVAPAWLPGCRGAGLSCLGGRWLQWGGLHWPELGSSAAAAVFAGASRPVVFLCAGGGCRGGRAVGVAVAGLRRLLRTVVWALSVSAAARLPLSHGSSSWCADAGVSVVFPVLWLSVLGPAGGVWTLALSRPRRPVKRAPQSSRVGTLSCRRRSVAAVSYALCSLSRDCCSRDPFLQGTHVTCHVGCTDWPNCMSVYLSSFFLPPAAQACGRRCCGGLCGGWSGRPRMAGSPGCQPGLMRWAARLPPAWLGVMLSRLVCFPVAQGTSWGVHENLCSVVPCGSISFVHPLQAADCNQLSGSVLALNRWPCLAPPLLHRGSPDWRSNTLARRRVRWFHPDHGGMHTQPPFGGACTQEFGVLPEGIPGLLVHCGGDGRNGLLEGQWGPQGRNDRAEQLTRHLPPTPMWNSPPPMGSLYMMAVLVGWMYRPSFDGPLEVLPVVAPEVGVVHIRGGAGEVSC